MRREALRFLGGSGECSPGKFSTKRCKMVQNGAIWCDLRMFFFLVSGITFLCLFFKEEGEIATCAIYKIIRNTLHTHPSFGNGFGLPLRSSPLPFLHTLACDCLGCLTLQNHSLSGKVNWREFTAKNVRPVGWSCKLVRDCNQVQVVCAHGGAEDCSSDSLMLLFSGAT